MGIFLSISLFTDNFPHYLLQTDHLGLGDLQDQVTKFYGKMIL